MIRQEDGSLVWKPTLKQERFLSIPLTVKEGFYAGAVNAGKTDVLLMYPIVHGWYKHPRFKGVFLRRTMPELRNEVIPRSEERYKPFGAVYNKQEGIWTFPSGARIYMGYCEYEKDVHNYDSMEINYLAFDELTSFTEWMYTYLTIERVRVNELLVKELPAVVRSGSNPGNVGHKFVFERFIKPFPSGGKILIGKGGMKRIFIPATINDNPHASKQYIAELDALPEAERRAKKGGDWQAYEGQVFSEIRDKKIPSEPENAYHLVQPFEIPDFWPKVIAIDWGFNSLCSVGFGAISPNKRLYVYRHLMFQKEKIELWAPKVKYYVDKEQIKEIIICHSANQHRGDPHTIQEQVSNALEETVNLGGKDRVAGKTLLHEYLRYTQKPPIPIDTIAEFSEVTANALLRNKGVRAYNDYIKQYLPPEPELNLPKLQFFDLPEVRVIIDAIKACVYVKSDKDGKKKEDVAEFDGDDPYDMLRMMLHLVDNYFELAETEYKNIQEVQIIIDRLNTTGNMTGYYMDMNRLENKRASEFIGIPRYNSRRHFRAYRRH